MSILPEPRITGVADLLETRAREFPDTLFFLMNDTADTFGAFNRRANRFAHGLAGFGIGPREIVGVMMPNAPEFMYAWFGILKLGAVEVPINTALRGQGLSFIINVCEMRVLILDESNLEQLAEVADQLEALETVILRGDVTRARAVLPFRIVAYEDVHAGRDGDPERPPADPYEPAMIMFTSGTTGRSKGCVLCHRYLIHHAELVRTQFRITRDDTLYCPFPLFHADAAYLTILPAILTGCRAALSERFSASRYWSEIRKYGATVFDFMGATLTILWKQPPQPDDADNPVRLAWGVPMPEFADAFEKRFNLKLVEVYGLTDAGVGVYQPLDEPRRPGACGKPVDSYEYRIFDDLDRELPTGQSGEIVVRPREPGIIMNEYFRMPGETLAAMRNLWFHTGDVGFFDEDGYLHFVGRKKDSIRRRGENISAFEIEEAANLHPSVLESAAIGVPSELSEDDVMLFVVLKDGHELSPCDLISHCEKTMARYMVPRYLRFLDSLPKTPTEKVEKYKLADLAGAPGRWDRDADSAP
ncbi:ATP-dependent acyl-CoA ligase [Oceanibacterium hippocampi]|uniref:Long-chain-fatty-acid--CoA ligase n=1 Tax=Oceanibacterium hippocampi TaxID=745714 RepID=A0A1Y5TZT7_9PROT|nr:ATP-dependent acyl-CoA ligase [Oceanibacterium hippocampi]SLN77707.1 Long-chain-fatty-acid--CoA ligase [Oceanibacterium hippocampi]